jgi:hypothetical protein
MNSFSLNLHTARRIWMQRRCLNGTWQLQIVIDVGDDEQREQHYVTVFADSREALDLVLADDEYCRITGGDSKVEYSSAPFSAESSANGDLK